MDAQPDRQQAPARILIVDDHPNTASMLARVLGKMDVPVEVLTASSGEEALRIANDGRVDILITDYLMSGINGLDLIREMEEKDQVAYKILMTAYDPPNLKSMVDTLHIQNYLIKPVQPDKIREIILNALGELHPLQQVSRPARPKILVTNDSMNTNRLLAMRIRNEGYESLFALNSEEVIQKASLEKPDLILLDTSILKKDGLEVLPILGKDPETAAIPIVLIVDQITAREEGLAVGSDDYITKPVDWDELLTRIRNKLQGIDAGINPRAWESDAFLEINRDLGEQLDIEALTKMLLTRAAASVQAANGYLLVFHPDGRFTFQVHHLSQLDGVTWEETKLRLLSKGLISQSISDQRGMIVEDTRLNADWIDLPGVFTRSAIIMPLMGQKKILGVLVLTHDLTAHFKPYHLSLLQDLASQATVAIENAQLAAVENRRVDQLVAYNQLTQEIGRFTRSADLFERLPLMLCQMFGYPVAACWYLDKDRLSLKGLFDPKDILGHIPDYESGPKKAMSTQATFAFSGAPSTELGNDDREEIGGYSVIAVPIFWFDQLNGVIAIYEHRIGAFQESDRIIMELLAARTSSMFERIHLFESVEREQQRLSAILNGAADAILVLDTDERLEMANPTGQRLFDDVNTKIGYRLPEGQGYDDLIHLLEKTRWLGAPVKGEVSWPDSRTFSAQVSPIEGVGLVVQLHDVSHFKVLDQLKNDLVATASHDLKSPITAILGYSVLLGRAGPLNQTQVEFTERIRAAAQQMQDLVVNLLDMARMDMGMKMEMEAFDLNEMIRKIGDEYRPRIEETRHILNMDLSEAPAKIIGDRLRIRQVISNLVDNAIKYSPDGGEIHLSTQIMDDSVITSVRDAGIGIPNEAIPNLFGRFYRVRVEETDKIPGNGLGLAIVKSIVEKHGGRVYVESTVGKGSCFTFVLKASPD
jgi:signal transduction histidine kinase/DNA-binding response OmpR family regulator